MGHLDTAFNDLHNTLPVNWINSFAITVTDDDVTLQENVINAEVAVTVILDTAANIFFEELNLSIIAGEYVTDIDGYRTKLIAIEDYINDQADFEILGYPQITSVSQETFKSSFFHPVKHSLNSYKLLLNFVEKHLVYKPNTSTIFHLIKNDNKDSRDTNSAAKEMGALFQLNITLAQIDHSLSFDQTYFKKLLFVQKSLRELSTSTPTSEILMKKCGFLLYKISFRLQQSQQNYLYAIDFNYTQVEPSEIPEFQEYNDIIKGHYDDGMNPIYFNQRLDAALIKFEEAPTTLDLDNYHCLIKYFKDVKKDIKKLEKLKEYYETFYERERASANLFDKKAYDISYCYLENNIFSLELDQKKITLSNWNHKLNEYTDRAENFKNRNFFPYYKIVKEFLRKEIPQQFKLKDYQLNVIRGLIDEYKINLTKLIENVGICEETDYLPFQKNYDSCKVTFPDSSGTNRVCFISSSFSLPLNYKELKEELEIYKAELNQFNAMFEIQQLIDVDRKDIKTVKQEIERTDKRHIEILSIFAALVMFVSNEIQIFSKVPNMVDAVAYTLFFAFGLGLFVLMIWFITRPEGVKLDSLTFMHWFVVILFSIGLISAVTYVYTSKFPNKGQQQELSRMDFKIDSLKRSKTIDTLLSHQGAKTDSLKKAIKTPK
ncbi:hypothetical protein ACFGVS_20425 [Mucilaginibacter sp. AW1-7]|uniref:hypothetical protein n=1 Tax=Mucilaginibacter sp. AW1-7 TaxID=3349874 RepID=UPI003F73E10D